MSRAITVDVDLDDFEDEEILAAALSIVRHKEAHKMGTRCEEVIAKIRNVLLLDNDDSLPPASTAASIETMEALRNYISRQHAA